MIVLDYQDRRPLYEQVTAPSQADAPRGFWNLPEELPDRSGFETSLSPVHKADACPDNLKQS